MFGLKKSVNSSTDKSRSDFLDKDISNSHSDDSKFIFYAKTDQFISKLEIYVKPNNYKNIKKLILIKNEADFKELSSIIIESFKSTSEFKNISGLRVENLYKIQNDNRIILPTKGYISEYLKSGDIIYCDITSEEIWIKTYFKIIAYNFRKIIKLEYKLKKKMKFKQIKLILLKAGIELFWEELKQNNLDNTFNYYVENIKFNNKKRQKSQTGFELIEFNKQLRYLDNDDEILVNLKFGIFEELIHKQLITMTLNKKIDNYLRLNEYCNLFFEELLSSKKFESELGAIKDICREFFTSQYNDLNTPFFFYNFKKRDTVDEYAFNMINLNNGNDTEIEEKEDNEDDDEDDEFDYEGDTSFGLFYSQDASECIGNIKSLKQSKNSEMKKNKCDSNMIVIAPFLFQLIEIKKKTGLITNNINQKSGNVYRTFAHQNNNDNTIREKQDLNNFFIAPLSLDTNNNILKDDKSNLLYNDIDNTENDLTLDIGINKNINNKKEKMNLNDFLYNDNQNNISKYYVKNDDIKSQKSKYSIFSLMRLSKQSNCCNDLYNYFSQIEFIETIKKKYRYYITKKVMEKIIVPESRGYESVDNNFVIFLQKKEKEEEHSITIKNKKLIMFLVLFFLYYVLMIITINIL